MGLMSPGFQVVVASDGKREDVIGNGCLRASPVVLQCFISWTGSLFVMLCYPSFCRFRIFLFLKKGNTFSFGLLTMEEYFDI